MNLGTVERESDMDGTFMNWAEAVKEGVMPIGGEARRIRREIVYTNEGNTRRRKNQVEDWREPRGKLELTHEYDIKSTRSIFVGIERF